ncbi:MAG: hypothetical protein H0V01_11750 [Bacteroidetes bacterium]|nr:hypothetical protein [Bacteroidota bacterium]HET6243797.1 hypothetical protein [Bacteroidia bacterium]
MRNFFWFFLFFLLLFNQRICLAQVLVQVDPFELDTSKYLELYNSIPIIKIKGKSFKNGSYVFQYPGDDKPLLFNGTIVNGEVTGNYYSYWNNSYGEIFPESQKSIKVHKGKLDSIVEISAEGSDIKLLLEFNQGVLLKISIVDPFFQHFVNYKELKNNITDTLAFSFNSGNLNGIRFYNHETFNRLKVPIDEFSYLDSANIQLLTAKKSFYSYDSTHVVYEKKIAVDNLESFGNRLVYYYNSSLQLKEISLITGYPTSVSGEHGYEERLCYNFELMRMVFDQQQQLKAISLFLPLDVIDVDEEIFGQRYSLSVKEKQFIFLPGGIFTFHSNIFWDK